MDYKIKNIGRKSAREVLLLCTTAKLSPQVKERLNQIFSGPVDWQYFIKMANFQGVTTLVTHNLSEARFSSRIPRSYVNQLQQVYKYTVYRNILISNELANLVAILRNEDIETICLKGTVLAENIYGNSCLRPVTDMDILIHPGDKEKANDVVIKLGYKPTPVRKDGVHPFHQEYYKAAALTLFLELHWNLDNRQLVVFPEDTLWLRSQPLDKKVIPSRTLSPEDNIMFLANHLHKHNKHRLKLLCDIAELLKKYQGILDWDYITSSAMSWQINSALYFALKRAEELLKAPVPEGTQLRLKPNIWKRLFIELFAAKESYITQSTETKLNREKAALAQTMMMKGKREMKTFLTRYRGQWKSFIWLRTTFWVLIAIIASLGQYLTSFIIRHEIIPENPA